MLTKIKYVKSICILIATGFFTQVSIAEDGGLYIVKDGNVNCRIIQPDKKDERAVFAMQEFVKWINRSCDVDVPVMDLDSCRNQDNNKVTVIFGDNEITEELGLSQQQLDIEEYRLYAKNNLLVFQGSHKPALNQYEKWRAKHTTTWAVTDFADKYIGVRWLWPGETGTYIPRRKDIHVPETNIKCRPLYETRIFMDFFDGHQTWGFPNNDVYSRNHRERLRREMEVWTVHHKLGNRSQHRFNHGFVRWWEKYHKTYPQVFGRSAKGNAAQGDGAKLNIGNEKVDELILEEWKKAGAPDTWNLGVNDGNNGWACQPESMALDLPEKYDPDDVFAGRVPLATRYARFWNRILGKMKTINPRASISVYAYGVTRQPPSAEIDLNHDIAVQIVPNYSEEDIKLWEGWHSRGVKIGLRPNWWHTLPYSPFLPLKEQLHYFDMCRKNEMLGYCFDAVLGDYGVKSPIYYCIARMGARPDLSADDVINEYTSAFGPASDTIKEYLDLWNDQSARLLKNESANFEGIGGFEDIRQKLEEKGMGHPRYARFFPYLFSDGTITKAYELLEKARHEALESKHIQKDEFLKRIDFLVQGLRHFEYATELVQLSSDFKGKAYSRRMYMDKFAKLREFQKSMLDHVVWPRTFYSYSIGRSALLYPIELLYLKEEVSSAETAVHLPVTWSFIKDPEDKGETEKWFEPENARKLDWQKIRTDRFWLKQDAGKGYHGIAWYYIEFTMPEIDNIADSWIVFNSVDGQCNVWIDGEKVGEQMDYSMWDKPWALSAKEHLKLGQKHSLILRVKKDTAMAGVWKPVEIRVSK